MEGASTESVVRAHEPSGLPWRGPAPGRPDLPLPPDPMPVVRNGRMRKRWRYAAVYGSELMFCAANCQIGPFPYSFWEVWDRAARRRWGRTRMIPGSPVTMDGPEVRLEAGEVTAELRFGDGEAIESVCASGEGGYGWTRKRAGVEVEGTIRANGKSWSVEGPIGAEDISAGYHKRHIDWYWSAGLGETTDGRAVAWNLVTGINDPPERSERAIWIDGRPSEPDPVRFDGLNAIELGDGSRLDFHPETERARSDNVLLIRSDYRHRFGAFEGSLAGLELRRASGVMEEHTAVW